MYPTAQCRRNSFAPENLNPRPSPAFRTASRLVPTPAKTRNLLPAAIQGRPRTSVEGPKADKAAISQCPAEVPVPGHSIWTMQRRQSQGPDPGTNRARALSRQPALRRRHCHRGLSAPVRHVGADRPGRGRRPALELLVRKPVPWRPEEYRQGRRGRKLIGSQGAVVRHADAVSVRMSSGRPGRQGRSSASAPGTSKLNPEA